MAAQPGGTAPKAQIPGYRVGGKTGTAYKIEGGQYVRKYVASFVGFAPVSDPRLVVAVMIDEPSAGGHYGGDVAGPIFSSVMGGALRTLGVPHDCADPGGAEAGRPRRSRPERKNYDSANGFHAGCCWRNHAGAHNPALRRAGRAADRRRRRQPQGASWRSVHGLPGRSERRAALHRRRDCARRRGRVLGRARRLRLECRLARGESLRHGPARPLRAARACRLRPAERDASR
jgi:membrane peptidoglycan carboxypeptidase